MPVKGKSDIAHSSLEHQQAAGTARAHPREVNSKLSLEQRESLDADVEQESLRHEGKSISLSGARPTIQFFGSQEHVRIGTEALPGETTLITDFGRITHGEMAALGDYFSSVTEIATLASMGDWGRNQIAYALWKVNPQSSSNPSGRPRPSVAQAVIEAVDERYYRLAARNEAHFSTGSAPGQSNREQYIAKHTEAVRAAYLEGLSPLTVRPFDWRAQEAFAAHFLEDAFSGGHVRTPRGDIQRHWEALYPGFRDNLVRMIACHMAAYINDRDNVGWVQTVGQLTDRIAERIRQQGGAVLSSFSIGDLISKVMHDADNAGLDVVSDEGVSGQGPVRWRAVGDDFLFPTTPNPAADQTRQMVERAVQLSWQEGQRAYSAGVSGGATLSSLTNPSTFQAPRLIPRADSASTTNPAYAWRAPNIRTLPANIKALIENAFRPGKEIRNGLDSMAIDPITTSCVTDWGPCFTLHTGDAWNCFKGILLANPLEMIARIGDANVCPTGNNNPCPVGR
jgi:hypothetical protein